MVVEFRKCFTNFMILITLFGILGQVWCLTVSSPDLCPISYLINLAVQIKNTMGATTIN